MSHLLIYIPIFLVMVLSVWWKARYDVRKRREALRDALAAHSCSDEMSEAERDTRQLLGDKVYDDMVARVKTLLDIHDGEESSSVSLTVGPSDGNGRERLHSLLPGDKLRLEENCKDGVRQIEVYSDEYRIGALMLTDAEVVLDIMEHSRITGVYVAEQNSYGESDVVSMRVIVFYTADAEESRAGQRERLFADIRKMSPYKITVEGNGHSYTLYQN